MKATVKMMALTDSIKFVNVIMDDSNILTATPETVLSGNVFVGMAKTFQVGNVPVLQEFTNQQLISGESFTVAFGYNPREYTISVASLADQTPGNCGPSHILEDHIAWSNGEMIEGTMPNNGDINLILGGGEYFDIPMGYHNGHGRISVISLAEQTMGTALASHILLGKRAWVNGEMITGTMEDNEPADILLSLGQSYIIPEGYHSGLGRVIIEPLDVQTPGTATETDILVGETAWVNGEMVTGSIPKNAGQEIILPINGTYEIPYGMHTGLGRVKQVVPTTNTITATPGFKDQIINVMGTYMLGNIILTGIDALNYNRYDKDSTEAIKGNIYQDIRFTTDIDIEIGSIPVDNWHDQATDNVYNVQLSCKNVNSNTELWSTSGMMFIGNLSESYHGTNSMDVLINPAEPDSGLKIILSQNIENREHTFTLKGMVPTIMRDLVPNGNDIEFDISVYNVLHLRRFGDEHDVD